MDPLSITAGCVALLGNLASAGLAISNFIHGYKEAAEDFVTITRELAELRAIASTLQRDCDNSSASSIPIELRPQIAAILKNCDAVVLQVQSLVDKYMASSKKGAAKRALRGREDVTKLQVSLETHSNALGLTLGMISISLTKAVKDDTTVIKEGMVEVREIAAHLLKGIEAMRKLEGDAQTDERLDLGGRFLMLERYLDDMTSYADTVVGEDLWEDSETRSIQVSSENSSNDYDSHQIRQAEVKVAQSNIASKPLSSLMTSKKDHQQEKQHYIESAGESPASGNNPGQASVEDAGQTDQTEPPPLSTFVHLGRYPPIDAEKLKRELGGVRKTVTVIGHIVGKTALIRTFVEKKYPLEYLLPTMNEAYWAKLDVGYPLELSILDTGGLDDYDRLRPLSYPNTDLFLLCFDLGGSDLLSDGEDKWIPEVRKYCPKTPVVLVGCRKDVRECPPAVDELCSQLDPVSWATGEALARKIGAVMYMECSAKTGEGVEAVFTEPFKVIFPDKADIPAMAKIWDKTKKHLRHRLFSRA
ncbi:hypothetical protein NCS57_00791800 [Fusarium keratoplasticum]|uniref:Uncharacterized protein n=1 Tax=Fusarium keratoplasticum TaxID=1328300 RepID=A0ACC0QXI6_9HYPO|nr:hypothetical protein NCS57_00791800 [Fusarium keratoplasticum]KAI8669757.1 hypothetical protein NCS57_00791800 [Fusarium keratoplasticum]KAI8674339.1 hypothetical protein NCS55_00757600 [Fusarium keratoplasticum]